MTDSPSGRYETYKENGMDSDLLRKTGGEEDPESYVQRKLEQYKSEV